MSYPVFKTYFFLGPVLGTSLTAINSFSTYLSFLAPVNACELGFSNEFDFS